MPAESKVPRIDAKPVSEAPVESKKRTYDEITNLEANGEEAKLPAEDSAKTTSGGESKRLKKEESSAPSNRPSTLLSESQKAEEARQRAIIVTDADEDVEKAEETKKDDEDVKVTDAADLTTPSMIKDIPLSKLQQEVLSKPAAVEEEPTKPNETPSLKPQTTDKKISDGAPAATQQVEDIESLYLKKMTQESQEGHDLPDVKELPAGQEAGGPNPECTNMVGKGQNSPNTEWTI